MRYKLVVFDMDGVIFEHSNVWMELHKKLGTYEEGVKLTERYLKTDYAKLVQEVVSRLWKGKSATAYYELIKSIKYIEGAKEAVRILKCKGYATAIISSGPKELALRASEEIGIDYIYTNELVIKDNIITGEFIWPIAADRKAVVLKGLARDHHLHLSEIIVVGDSAADIKMMRLAGLGIAFCTDSAELKDVANIMVDKQDLREILSHIEAFEKKQILRTFD